MITRTNRRRRQRQQPPQEERLSLHSWEKGKMSTNEADRTPADGLQISRNTMLKQDGTAGPRPSTVRYGVQPTGTVLGAVTPFTRRVGGTVQNYEVCLQNVGGTVNAYYRKDGGSWLIAPGKTFNATAKARFIPIRDIDANYNDEDKVLICNQQDYLSYLDINTLTVVPFVALSAVNAPALTVGGGLTGSNFPNYYKVTAANRGETAASAETTVPTSKLRSEWAAATEYIDVTITRVIGAGRYHVYYGTESGTETYIGSIDDPGTGTTVTYRDAGAAEQNIYRPAPQGDTTAGPICGGGAFINGRVLLVLDKNNPKYTRYGGTGKSILDFSPYGGGGYDPVGGNQEVPVAVTSFHNPSGTSVVTVLCSGEPGNRYTFTPATIGNISYFAIEEAPDGGTDAPDSVIVADNQLWSLSRRDVNTTLTKAQLQTILSTDSAADLIQKEIAKFNAQTLPLSVGLAWQKRLLWAVAIGTPSNNQIWALDLTGNRRGAWMLPWEIAADWLWLYTDNSGITHCCLLRNNKIYEFTTTVATQDDGVAFPTGLATGILKFSDDGKVWADVSTVTFVFQRPQGHISVKVVGKTEDASIAPVGGDSFIPGVSVVGWSEGPWGARPWSGIGRIPQTFGIERTELVVDVGEELQWLSCEVTSQDANVSYELTDIIVTYVITGTKD